MKKKITIILAVGTALLLCALAACAKGPDRKSLQSYMDANLKEALWERHQIFRLDFDEYDEHSDGSVRESLYYYMDSDCALWDFSRGEKWLYGRDYSLDLHVNGDERTFYTHLCEEDALCEEWLDWAKANEFLVSAEADRVLETSDDGRGTFTAVVEYNDEDKVPQIIEENAPDLPDGLTYEKGMAIRYKLFFSTETKDLLEYDTFLVRPGEEPSLLNTAVYTYDGERSDPFADGAPFGDYRAAAEDPARSRTITVVFGPDAEDENVREFVVPQHAGFFLYEGGSLAKEYYTDRACTRLYEGDDGIADLTLYVPRSGEVGE